MYESAVGLLCFKYIFQLELRKIYEEQTIPEYLSKFEMLLKQNNGGDGYLVGDKVSKR